MKTFSESYPDADSLKAGINVAFLAAFNSGYEKINDALSIRWDDIESSWRVTIPWRKKAAVYLSVFDYSRNYLDFTMEKPPAGSSRKRLFDNDGYRRVVPGPGGLDYFFGSKEAGKS